MSSRPARHRRPDQSSLAGERLLARLAATPTPPDGRAEVAGWVPERPAAPQPSPVRVRWAPGRRAVIGVGVVVLVAVLVALVIVWRAQPAAQAAPLVRRDPPATAPAAGAGAPVSAAPITTEVVVHVVGGVRHPGLLRLPAGARVADAVRAAGGFTGSARRASVNLARVLADGEQLVVARRGSRVVLAAPAPGAAPGGSAATAPSAPVDLNTATLETLDSLPGIGPVLAQRILDWRTANGRFSAVDELGEVSGIGEATLAELRPVVTV